MTAAPSAPDTPDARDVTVDDHDDDHDDDLTLPSPRRPASLAPPAGLGTPRIDGLYSRPAPTGRTSGLAVASLVAGGLVPPLGVVLGVVALRRLRDRGDRGRGLAIWGIVLGSVISLLVALGVALSALHAIGAAAADRTAASGAVSQVCSGEVCTVTARGAPVTVDGIGADGADGVTVLTIGEGTAAVVSRQGPLEVATGTALELQRGTEVVLTRADTDTVVFVYQR